MEQVLKRMGFREGDRCLMKGAPRAVEERFVAHMQPPPDKEAAGQYPIVIAFYETESALLPERQTLVDALETGGRLWVCYPKKTSKKYKSDITRDSLWPMMGEWGMEPVSQYAVDEDWSAIRFRPVEEIKRMVRQRAATPEGEQKVKETIKKRK